MWKIDLSYRDELAATFERIAEKKEQLDLARPIPEIAMKKIVSSLQVEWTYNSNGIEGNTITLQETHLILQDGITVKGKSLREHFEVNNHDKALTYLYKLVKPRYKLNSKDILSIHGYILNNIEDMYAGRIRNAGVRIQGANFVPPNARKVSGLLDELIEFVLKNPLKLNVLELAAVFHHKFVWIHPFFDGNGRTVRLAMNLLLMSAGFPPAIILKNDRKKYYTALNSANKGNYQKLMLVMAQALERTLNIYISAIITDADDYLEISSIAKEPTVPYGQEYISLLARQGKIDAYKEGRNWLTTKKAIEQYINHRKRKRLLN